QPLKAPAPPFVHRSFGSVLACPSSRRSSESPSGLLGSAPALPNARERSPKLPKRLPTSSRGCPTAGITARLQGSAAQLAFGAARLRENVRPSAEHACPTRLRSCPTPRSACPGGAGRLRSAPHDPPDRHSALEGARARGEGQRPRGRDRRALRVLHGERVRRWRGAPRRDAPPRAARERGVRGARRRGAEPDALPAAAALASVVELALGDAAPEPERGQARPSVLAAGAGRKHVALLRQTRKGADPQLLDRHLSALSRGDAVAPGARAHPRRAR